MDKLLYYDNIALEAKYFDGDSRSGCDTSVIFGPHKFKLPITPANMKCSIDFATAELLGNNGYFYVLHRFYTYEEIKQWVIDRQDDLDIISISIGIQKDDYEFIDWLTKMGSPIVDYITIDVAHGHCKGVKDMLSYITDKFNSTDVKPFIIAGNVMTRQAVEDLSNWGADAVKVGIGQGRVCSTKLKTGFTCPMFSCVLDCSTPYIDKESITTKCVDEINQEVMDFEGGKYPIMPYMSSYHLPDKIKWLSPIVDRYGNNIKNATQSEMHDLMKIELDRRIKSETKNQIPIIADGGMSNNGDIAKAIRAGAVMTMAGSMFAACIDSAAESIFEDDNPIPIKKRYYGSASEENKGYRKNIEGFLVELNCNGFTYLEKLQEITEDLQSSISYAGGCELLNLRNVDYHKLS